ncbi:hypothetical protein L873DRAFT_1812665 [Choiromyces venosus 120613-1]|uniref:Uncharacterized protein n=1 Tax=Choiromyces venosus 120613-1 TaxID=1336337 RepID=A0A3N4JNT9_9PEZI|nr:hypothetical protein L873DRAFT_1812665 [Choiromyces venosus 120613-1]
MGMPVWKEPVEKRDIDAVLDPRRAAVPRRSAPSRRIRSSQTLLNLLRDDFAREANTLSSITGSEGRRERSYPWSELSAIPGPVPDPERAGLRVTLSDAEARASSSNATSSRGGIRRVRSPLPVFRSENNRLSSSVSDTYTPRFPPAFPERQQEEELRRIRTPFSVAAAASSSEGSSSSNNSTASRRAAADEGSQRPPSYFPRYEFLDEAESARRDEYSSYLPGLSARRWFEVDGLGYRERSLSPDPNQWELVANGLGFQAACDLWESDSDADGNPLASEVMLDPPQDRDEAFRIRRLFSSRNGGIDRLMERL